MQAGDSWLLCTDGVHGHADGAGFAAELEAAASAEGAAVGLVESALAAGTTDNATALVVWVAG
jgi:serine/threonine protein phosphatase PrpC